MSGDWAKPGEQGQPIRYLIIEESQYTIYNIKPKLINTHSMKSCRQARYRIIASMKSCRQALFRFGKRVDGTVSIEVA